MLHYFRWLEDSGDEVAKMAVLRSPFYLLSDEGLYWLRRGELDRLTPKEQEALARAEEDYSALQLLAKHQPAPVVIGELLRRTGYVEKTWRLPFGPQKVANIEKLLEQSWDLFARDVYTVPEQVRYLRLLAREAHKEGEAQLDAEHADVVILRTIHNAKGLEFPVVFLADTNAGPCAPRAARCSTIPSSAWSTGKWQTTSWPGGWTGRKRPARPSACSMWPSPGRRRSFLVRPDGQGGQRQLVELVSGASAPH